MKFLLLLLGVFLSLSSPAGAAPEWNEYKGQHFLIYYKDAPMDFVQNVDESAERYYQEITENLGFTRYKSWSWDDRAQIYIYKDQDDYVNHSRQAHWSHGSASAREKIIRTFPSAHGFFDSTLPHELGHIIFREFIGMSADVPLWMEEGVAMYQEKAKRWGANDVVRQTLKDGRFIPLEDLSQSSLLRNANETTVDLFYAESASIVYYLISEIGEYRFVYFCRRLSEGDTFLVAFKMAFVRFRNLDDLNKAWVEYLNQ